MRLSPGSVAYAIILALPLGPWAAAQGNAPAPHRGLAREVRHQLVTLPFYTVFDSLDFQIDGGAVRLLGEVTHPLVKDDAEKAVKAIPGVQRPAIGLR